MTVVVLVQDHLFFFLCKESQLKRTIHNQEPYWHLGYEYSLHRTTMPRSGEGDLWINYENDPKITLQGVAQSPKFGTGILVRQKELCGQW